MIRLAIIGSGVVGAAIAYELSALPRVKITLIERQSPGMGATGAALGVLMGVISQKTQGRAWQLRQQSLQRYRSLIVELEGVNQRPIPGNRQGILALIDSEKTLGKYQRLVAIRQAQGWPLEIWQRDRLKTLCPYLNLSDAITAAVYSPQDQQVDPVAFTQALVDGAVQRGVTCHFGNSVQTFQVQASSQGPLKTCRGLTTEQADLSVDGVIIAAGLGSLALTQGLASPVALDPVLGQAMMLRLSQPVENANFQPVIRDQDLTIVPLTPTDYWVGATVEFPPEHGLLAAQLELLTQLQQQAIALYPAFGSAERREAWSGLRPRPQGQPAPVIGVLPPYDNVFLATGHYRNGVLLAPATALAIRHLVARRFAIALDQ